MLEEEIRQEEAKKRKKDVAVFVSREIESKMRRDKKETKLR